MSTIGNDALQDLQYDVSEADKIAVEEIEEAEILVSVGGHIAEMLTVFESALQPLTRAEIAEEMGLPQKSIQNLMDTVEAVVESCQIEVTLSGTGEKIYSMNFFDLTGATIPMEGTTFDEKEKVEVEKLVTVEKLVDKIVEKEIEVIKLVEIGTALKPKPTTKKARAKKSTKPNISTIGGVKFRWSDGYHIPKPMDGYVKLDYHDKVGRLLEHGRHVGLVGPSGVGKSTVIKELAHENGKRLAYINASAGLRERNLTGSGEMKDATTWFNAADYATAVKEGDWVIVDEVNAAQPDALMFMNSQLAPPFIANVYGSAIPVHPDFRLIVTYNMGYVGTKPLPQSLVDRFYVLPVKYPDDLTYAKMLVAHGAADFDTLKSIISVSRQLWNAPSMRYEMSPRRMYDALLTHSFDIFAKDSLQTAMYESILPQVWASTEVETVKSLISTGIVEAPYYTLNFRYEDVKETA